MQYSLSTGEGIDVPYTSPSQVEFENINSIDRIDSKLLDMSINNLGRIYLDLLHKQGN